MVKSSTKILAQGEKYYSESLKEAQCIVKRLKSQDNQKQGEHSSNLVDQTTEVIQFMSQPDAYKEKNYTRSFVLLDNLLVLNKDLLYSIKIPSLFLQNLCRFFIAICKLQGEHNQPQKLEASIYGCLYLILLLIHKASSDRQIRVELSSTMFTYDFVNSLTGLDITNPSDKMIRVIAMILTYIVRSKSISQIGKQIKEITLTLLEFANEQVSRAYLSIVLRKVSSYIKPADICKYNILGFLFTNLQSGEHDQIIKNTLWIVNFILQNFKQFGEEMIKMNLIKHWDQYVKTYPEVCFQIFKGFLPLFSCEKKDNWFKIYVNHAVKNPYNVGQTHFKILESLCKEISLQNCLWNLQNSFISKMQNFPQTKNADINKAIERLMNNFVARVKQIDENLFITLQAILNTGNEIHFHTIY